MRHGLDGIVAVVVDMTRGVMSKGLGPATSVKGSGNRTAAFKNKGIDHWDHKEPAREFELWLSGQFLL